MPGFFYFCFQLNYFFLNLILYREDFEVISIKINISQLQSLII